MITLVALIFPCRFRLAVRLEHVSALCLATTCVNKFTEPHLNFKEFCQLIFRERHHHLSSRLRMTFARLLEMFLIQIPIPRLTVMLLVHVSARAELGKHDVLLEKVRIRIKRVAHSIQVLQSVARIRSQEWRKSEFVPAFVLHNLVSQLQRPLLQLQLW